MMQSKQCNLTCLVTKSPCPAPLILDWSTLTVASSKGSPLLGSTPQLWWLAGL